jgi:hypothetical protein
MKKETEVRDYTEELAELRFESLYLEFQSPYSYHSSLWTDTKK